MVAIQMFQFCWVWGRLKKSNQCNFQPGLLNTTQIDVAVTFQFPGCSWTMIYLNTTAIWQYVQLVLNIWTWTWLSWFVWSRNHNFGPEAKLLLYSIPQGKYTTQCWRPTKRCKETVGRGWQGAGPGILAFCQRFLFDPELSWSGENPT